MSWYMQIVRRHGNDVHCSGSSQDYKHFSTLTVFRDVYNNLVTVRIRGKLPVNSFALTSACPEQWYLCLSVAISLYAKPL